MSGPVPFVHGRTRAHVMRWQGADKPYLSICNYRVVRHWPSIRWTGHDDRRLPWCRWCVGRVRDLAVAVLGP